jgi:hypothetical protein
MRHLFISLLLTGASLISGCNQAASNSAITSASPVPPVPSPTPAIPKWERRVQADELSGNDDDWYTITAGPTNENAMMSGPLADIHLDARIALLCKNHKFVHGQFEPRLRDSLYFDGYRYYAIPARLDDKTMHTFHWGLADSADTYLFGKSDVNLLLQHKKAVIGVTSGGHQVALKFWDIPQPDPQMQSDCGLGSHKH